MMRAITRPEVAFPLASVKSSATGQLSDPAMVLKSACLPPTVISTSAGVMSTP